ncbi:MAG: phosphotransferase [Oscillospiraceae bacterium]|jgi:Ser/Thr protein kinase RdoA (MazF antagonist)|nr:phosphotransferase [Oscillospiraceae bacterium]
MTKLLDTLNARYPLRFDTLEHLRDGGSASYAGYSSSGGKYFLRNIKPAFFDTVVTGTEIQMFLHEKDFPVPLIVRTKDGSPSFTEDDRLYILYDYVEGEDSDPKRNAEEAGALTGRLHRELQSYPGSLVERDKRFYIDRYINILRGSDYPRTDEFSAYGDALWEKVQHLPRGVCHGDLYCGNVRRTPGGALVVHDFDTACVGLLMYDIALFCNQTNYFLLDEKDLERSNTVLSQFLPEYTKYRPVSEAERNAFHALIALQHFATQATIMELYGYSCLSGAALDNQLDWLTRWRNLCEWDKHL